VKLTVRAAEPQSGRESVKSFFAKVYASGAQVDRARNVQQNLALALQSASEPFGLAPVVAYLSKARVLV